MLTGNEIIKQVKAGKIYIEDFDEKKVNPNSYNLTLSNKLLVYSSHIIDMKEQNPTETIIIPEEGLILYPGMFYLGMVNEEIFTEHYIPNLSGRSSIGRLGLQVHCTAGFIDIGFCGRITLEINVFKHVRIYPNVEIAQLSFESPEGDTSIKYNGKYQNSIGIVASKMFNDRSFAEIKKECDTSKF